MAKSKTTLVIIEAPGKRGKIAKYLGSSYEVVATKGHIRDLPKSKLSVDIKNDFEPTYKILSDKKEIVKHIKSRAKQSKEVLLASDEDREGEAIAGHVASQLPKGTNYKRVKYNSITKTAIENGIKNAGPLDDDMFHSYEARRILDRLVGYKCSFITKQATGGKSAGRVQSAGLRILAEREKEIQSFVPDVYWPVEAVVETDGKDKISATVKNPKPLDIESKEEAEKIIERFEKGPIKVHKFSKKNWTNKAYAPFTTSTLQQAASTYLGFSPDRTMRVAQNLYQKSLISYHRTDSRYIEPQSLNEIRNYIQTNFSNNYLPNKPNFFGKGSKTAQQAHEAIRPTDVKLTKYSGGKGDEKKLYELIWKRTVGSQMNPATYDKSSVDFKSGKFVLHANGSKMTFDGFRKVWDFGGTSDQYLPDLTEGDEVSLDSITTERKETNPPPRFSEASFVKELEKKEIGRPSTYSSIISTLKNRSYIEVRKKAIHTTDLGIRVSDFLIEVGFCFVDLDFTKDMESDLDDIATGKKDKVQVLKSFWERLKKDIEKAKDLKKEKEKTDFPCPECKKNNRSAILLKKNSKYGPFFTCENYNNKDNKCEYKADVGDDGKPKEKTKKEIEESEHDCPNCGEKLVVRTSKRGNEYLGCRNWNSDKDCKGFYQMDGTKMDFSKKKYKKKNKKKKKKS